MDNRLFADVIIDISHEAVDRPFQYIIPLNLTNVISEGVQVNVPFGKGNSLRKGYVINITDKAKWPIERMKEIDSVNKNAVGIEERALELALFLKRQFGSTLITAMQTVLPVKQKVRENVYKTICLNIPIAELIVQRSKCNPYRQASRKRLLEELEKADAIPYSLAVDKLNISPAVISTLEKNEIIRIEKTREYRRPEFTKRNEEKSIELSDEQIATIEGIKKSMDEGEKTSLIHGITGSGKTVIYMELASYAISKGQQVIMLIPEIALTFQTLMRFYERFGDRVSVVHSRLSGGEKYDQFEQAKNGKLDIIIGPRSALFTPFNNLGLIIIDEEHESSYKSDKMPKYDAVTVARHLAHVNGGNVVLGSATPSIESYSKAIDKEYDLYELKKRHGQSHLPTVYTVDMREELKSGNRSYFSNKLKELIRERIARGQQIMLFLNRRGYAGFVSCRSCGYVMKCPHCEVSLSHHKGSEEKMICHYCGYETKAVKICPKCQSKYFSGFRVGTEKLEEELKKEYPSVSVLRMDADTTKSKDDYDRILSQFAAREADVLIGTQMIVKGHDFSGVTLVGIVAADMSLNASDYKAEERTFQLITQAAGRAGRGDDEGEVVIQTYNPDNYALVHAANQDYESFFKEEMLYRKLADYPPVSHMLAVQIFAKDEAEGDAYASRVAEYLRKNILDRNIFIIGPANAVISKIRDIYRKVIYIKCKDKDKLIDIKDMLEEIPDKADPRKIIMQFDFDPESMF